MPIQFACACGKTLQAAEEHAGMEADCPGCGSRNRIPDPTAPLHAVTEILPFPVPTGRSVPPPLPPGPAAERIPIDESKPLTTHAGMPITDDDDFFVPASDEIGTLISAFTSLKKHKAPLTSGARSVIVLGSLAGGILLAILLSVLWTGVNAGMAFWMLGLGGFGLFLSFYLTGFSHTCTYVGKDGLARYRCRGGRAHIVQDELFLFHDALELRIGQTRHYYNGAYTGTSYTYTWTDARKKTVYAITGRYQSEAGTPKPADAYWFAHSADMAWSIYLLNNMEAFADDRGSYYFGLKKANAVEVGPGYLTLFLGGDPIRLRSEDIAQVQINQGIFAIREPGAKEGWFSSHGVYKFPYHDLDNAQFFLFLLERLVGVRATP